MRQYVSGSFGSARILVLGIFVGGLMFKLMVPSVGLTEGNSNTARMSQ